MKGKQKQSKHALLSWVLCAVMTVTSLSPLGVMNVQAATENKEVHVYADTPGDVQSAKYTLTANGTTVPVIKYEANNNNFDIARFASSDATPEYQVQVSEEIQTVTVYPERYYPKENIVVSEDKHTITFTMSDKLRYAFVMINGGPADQAGKPYLAIINDPPETNKPDLLADNVLNAKTFMEDYLKEHPNEAAQTAVPAGTTSGGKEYAAGELVENATSQVRFPNKRKMTEDDVTYALQAALDEIYKDGSTYDTLYFPAGTYTCSGLEIRNRKGKDVTIYVEEGALIKNRLQECMQAMEPAIGIWDSERITISGRGIFDGNGVENYRKDRHDAKDSCHQGGVMIVRSSNITFNDTYVRDAKQWNWESHGSKNCNLNNIKGLTPYNQPWVDGLDMASAQDLTINGAITLGNDDCFASGHYNPSDGFPDTVPGYDEYNSDCLNWDTEDSFNVSVSNTLGWSYGGGNGIRMGHNTYGKSMKNYSFNNLNAINFNGGDRGITIQNNVSNKYPYPNYESISIKNCSFDTTRAGHNIEALGLIDNKIGELTLENCWFSKQSSDFKFENIKNLIVKDLYVGGELVKYSSQVTTNFAAALENGSIEKLTFTGNGTEVLENQLPVFTQPLEPIQAYGNAPLTFFVKTSDPDLGDIVTFGDADLTETPGAVFDQETGKFSWTPTEEQAGNSYQVTFTAFDHTNQIVSHSVTIQVSSAKDEQEYHTVTEDAHMQTWNTEKDQNFGKTIYLTVNKSDGNGLLGETGTPGDGKLVLLKFDLTGLKEKKGQYDKAMLSLTYITLRKTENKNQEDTLKVAVVDDSTWSEDTLTWTNKPSFTIQSEEEMKESASYNLGDADKDKPPATFSVNGKRVYTDITDFVNAALDANKDTLTLAVNDANGYEHYFVSKEGALGGGVDGKGNSTSKYDNATADMAPSIVINLPQQPAIQGPETLSLSEGYTATETNSFQILGMENPTITLSGNTGEGKITWDDTTHQLKIAEGLKEGTYEVTLTATVAESQTSTCSFTLTITPDVKKELRALYQEKKELVQGNYTSASWKNFTDTLTLVENVLNNKDTTAAQAQEAINRLTTAEQALETLEAALQSALQTYAVEEGNENKYTESSWNLYQTAYQAALDLQKKDNYTEAEVTKVVADLKTAYQALEEVTEQPEKPWIATLEKAIKDYMVADSNEKDYTTESWKAYKTAYQAALDLQKKDNYTEAEVTTVVANLKKAYEGLKKAEQPTPKPWVATLAKAIKDYMVADSNEKDYTTESWKAYKTAYQAALDLQKKDNYTEAEVTTVVANLKKAYEGLKKAEQPTPKPWVATLAKAIKDYMVADSNEKDYTTESWKAYKTAYQAALDLQKKDNYTEAQVTTVVANLKKAYQGLKKVEQPKPWVATLAKAIKDYKVADSKKGLYTEASWKAYKTAYQAALDLQKKDNYTEAEVTTVVANLKKAYQGLKKKPAPVKVKTIKITGSLTKLAKGKKVTLKTTVTPKNATNKSVTWSSSNQKVAKVSQKGVVTAVKKGTANITAKAKDGSKVKSKVYKITVVDHAVKKVSLKTENKTVAAGKKATIKATISTTGKNANKTLKWSTSNKKYATVSSKGVVTTKKAGAGKTVKITAQATDGSNKKATISIKIVKHAVKSVKLSGSKSVKAGKKVTIKATVKTTGKTASKKLVWSTSNKKYATVSSKGVVSTKKAGKGKTVTITAKATDGSGKKGTIKIKMK